MKPAPRALIGHTGFVGATLLRARPFEATFNSANSAAMRGGVFSHMICAGVSAVKWWANQNPAEDWARIAVLMDNLAEVEAENFVLISTVDVYARPLGVTETDAADAVEPYGLHRARFEDFIRARFPGARILRLPALFGEGLKKNAVFDLLHDNRLDAIDPGGLFQWYPLDRLAADLDRMAESGIGLLNAATEPVSIAEIRDRFFPGKTLGAPRAVSAHYDMRSRHADPFGGARGYLLDRDGVFAALGRFVARAQGAPA